MRGPVYPKGLIILSIYGPRARFDSLVLVIMNFFNYRHPGHWRELGLFLAASTWHFGEKDEGNGGPVRKVLVDPSFGGNTLIPNDPRGDFRKLMWAYGWVFFGGMTA